MLTPDTVLQDRYCIIRQLGKGGMGTVYEARRLHLNTTVALKETHFTDVDADSDWRKQFEREAQLLAGLSHPALPRVLDYFAEGDGLFLVMDFIAGEDLLRMLRRNGGAFSPDEVLEWADQLLDALNYLHNQKSPIIHRDIKPENLKLSNQSQITLLDFGLAKGFAGQTSRVTTSKSMYGYTPDYAPLEQIQGEGTDPRSDLYSLAATLYHLVTGRVPPSVLTRLAATSDGQPDPLRSANEINPAVPRGVAAALNKAMSIGRKQRFASAAEMRDTLRAANRRQASSINQAATLVLPPKAAPLTPTIERQDRARVPLPPTLAKTAPAPALRKPTSTIAAPLEAKNLKTPPSPESLTPRPRKSSNRAFGIIGGLLLAGGTFCPIIGINLSESSMFVSYIGSDAGTSPYGIILLLSGIAGIILTVSRKYKPLLIPGILAIAILAYDYFSFKSKLSEIMAGAGEKGAPIEYAVSMQWGWLVLLLGALILIAAGVTGKKLPAPGAKYGPPPPPYTPGRYN